MIRLRQTTATLGLWALFAAASALLTGAAPATKATTPGTDDNLIQLNFPQTTDLQTLIEYVSKRLGINILYDENIGKTRVSLSSPAKIDKDALLPLLQSVLDMANMELVDTTAAGWKTVGHKATVRFVSVKNGSAADLAKQVGSLLEEQDRMASGTGGGAVARQAAPAAGRTSAATASRGPRATLIPDPRTNQIAIVASDAGADAAQKLIESLDVPSELHSRSYRFHYIAPHRIDRLIRGRVQAMSPEPSYASTLDEASGLLLVTAPDRVHTEIELLALQLDVESDPNRSNIRFYKLINTTAGEVLATLRSLKGDVQQSKAESRSADMGGKSEFFTGPNALPSPPGMPAPLPPEYHETQGSTEGAAPTPALARPLPATKTVSAQGAENSKSASSAAALAQDAIITSDANTNSIIVVAPPETQKVFEQLISALDKRRPQVLVEVTLVTLNVSDDFSLGVELSAANIGKKSQTLVFSAFGLSTMDLTTGVPTLTAPATGFSGFNGVVVAGDTLSAIVHALSTNSRSKVLSAPKVLVNDNATATLESIAEAPFTSVNASNTVSTTSFAGYASAGTTVTISPHISEGEHLQLKYTIAVNSFSDTSSTAAVPPPRLTDSVNSEVTVPNGSAVIVGGLKRSSLTKGVTKIPFLGDIPILGYFFGSHTNSTSNETLFVFIRPLILRDDKFQDLKYLSDRDLSLAQLPANAPVSDPIIMQ